MSDLKEIDSKITELKVMVEKLTVSFEKDSNHFKERQQEHSVELWGKSGTPGLKTDVDRLKTQAGMIKWTIGAVATVFIERVYSWIVGKH